MLTLSRLGAHLVTPLAVLSFATTAAAQPAEPYVLNASAGYSKESLDDNVFDSSSTISSIGISRKIDKWNYAGGLTYNRKDVDSFLNAKSNVLGGYLSATGNLWSGGFVSVAASYGRNDTTYQQAVLPGFDADSIGYTAAVTQAIPLNSQFAAAVTAAYTYSQYRPNGNLVNDSSQGLLSTGARLIHHASKYQPYVAVMYKHYRQDLLGNDDLDFFDVSVGASLPLGNDRRIGLSLNNALGLNDYQRLGISVTYTHPFK